MAYIQSARSHTRISDVLAAWRAAERDLARAGDESATRERLQVIVSELRSLHGRLFDQQAGTLDHETTDGAAASAEQRTVAQHRP